MTIRKKLLLMLLGASLIPLALYFTINRWLARVARSRVQRTLHAAMEERAGFELLQAIERYGENLKLSTRVVRYGLRHYADKVEQALMSLDISRDKHVTPYQNFNTSVDFTLWAAKYLSLEDPNHDMTVDFKSQYIHGSGNNSPALMTRMPALNRLCRELYATDPESRVWIYTVLEDGPCMLFPSVGYWPYDSNDAVRLEQWYVQIRETLHTLPMPRVEPLTGQVVLTIAMPLLDNDRLFIGAAAIDIDLSAILDRMPIADDWLESSVRLLARVDMADDTEPNDCEIICARSFADRTEVVPPSRQLLDIGDRDVLAQIPGSSRRGGSGILRADCAGRDCLWAFGPAGQGGGFPIVIVDYQRIMDRVETARQVLIRDSVLAMQIATLVLFTAIVAAAVLAALRARNVTKPILNLADAAAKLAEGDFGVRVAIRTNDELQRLGGVFNQVGPRLAERENIKRSLELARQIQQHFLPTELPKLQNCQIAGLCRYCDETGGDYYDFFDLSYHCPGRIGLVVGDVSGHGIPAAMLMISAGSILRNNAPRHGENISEAIAELNRHLTANSEADKFMSLFYGLLEDSARSLSWVSAGHDPAFFYDRAKDSFSELPNTGMVLGVLDDAEFTRCGPITLNPGDIVLVGTDGIWEAQGPDGAMYGKSRLMDTMRQHRDNSAEDLCQAVMDSVIAFCNKAPIIDDITLIAVKCSE